MNCMKCRREIALGQVFCKECLADMAEHPVKPGTPVILPPREPASTAKRTTARKVRKPEDTIAMLRTALVIVSLMLLAVSLAFAITTTLLLQREVVEQTPTAPPGQNYSTEAST